MKSLERRIQKIEELLPQLPCPNREHGSLRILMYGVTPEQDRENDDMIESIENCGYCKAREARNKEPSILMFRTFARGQHDIPENLAAPPRGVNFTFNND